MCIKNMNMGAYITSFEKMKQQLYFFFKKTSLVSWSLIPPASHEHSIKPDPDKNVKSKQFDL